MADTADRFRRFKVVPPARPSSAAAVLGALRQPRRLARRIGVLALAFTLSAAGLAQLFGSLGPPQRTETRVALSEPAPTAVPMVSARFGRCVRGQGRDCVIDGDTLRIGSTIVRIADIDTPEVRNYDCAAEKALGDRATARLLSLVNAGPFAVEGYSRDEDTYGRKLRILTRDGTSIGMMLVDEGLARPWGGARRPWC